MSYDTSFLLTDVLPAEMETEIIDAIEKDLSCRVLNNYKVYWDYCTECERVSALFPNVMFKINGFGEEEEDIWTATYFGGKQIQYEKLDLTAFQSIGVKERKVYNDKAAYDRRYQQYLELAKEFAGQPYEG